MRLTLIDRIQDSSRLSAAQSRVARYLEMSFQEIPFSTSESIATEAGVSKATVVRCVQELGYDSLAHLRNEVRAELYEHSVSPVQRAALLKNRPDIKAVMSRFWASERDNLKSTIQGTSADTVLSLAETLVNANTVWVYGQRFSYGLAFSLALLLTQVLPRVRNISGVAGTTVDSAAAAGPDDHFIIIAHDRLGREKALLASYLAERGIPYSLVTDLAEPEASVGGSASFVLRSSTASVGPFNSYTASFSLVQAVAVAVEHIAAAGIDRLTTGEIALQRFAVFETERG